MNPSVAPGSKRHSERALSTPRQALYVLAVCSGAVILFVAACKLFGEPWWAAIGLLVSTLIATVLSGITCLTSLVLAVGTHRWQPAATGLVIGAVACAFGSSLPLPSPIRAVFIPVSAAGLTCAAMYSERDWRRMNRPLRSGSFAEWLGIGTIGALGLWLGISSEAGKPILIALNQDVVGVIRSEQIEIAVAGGLVGAGLGFAIGIIFASAFWPRAGNPLWRTFSGPSSADRAKIIDGFVESRQPQSASDFFAETGLQDTELNRAIVQTVRSEVAQCAGIPTDYLNSTDLLDHDLREHAGLDSLEYVELIMSIEDALGIELTDAEVERFPPIYLREVPVVEFIRIAHEILSPPCMIRCKEKTQIRR